MKMRKVLTVASYEFRVGFRRFWYLFATFGLPLLGALVLIVVQALHNRQNLSHAVSKTIAGTLNRPVAVYDEAHIFPTEAVLPKPFVLVQNLEEAKQKTVAGEYNAVVEIPKNYFQRYQLVVYSATGIASLGEVVTYLQPLIIYASLSGKFSAREALKFITPPKTKLILLANKKEHSAGGRFFLGYALSILFFTALFASTGYLLQSVVVEKESHAIEILLSSVTSMELLWGKVLGLGMLGLTQVLVWSISVLKLGKRLSVQIQSFNFPLSQLTHPDPQFVLAIVIVLPLSYLSYGLLMAGVGSLGDTTRESHQFSTVFSLVAMFPLLVNFVFFANPNGWVARALSYFPLTAPTALFMRLSVVQIPWWDFWLVVLALIVGTLASLWIGIRLFRVGILMTGKRPSWKEIWRIIRNPA